MSVTLKLHARGTALCQDYEAMEAGIRRYIGWRRDNTVGTPYVDRETKEARMSGGFEKTGVVVEKTFASVVLGAQYIHEIQHKALWAADEATAKLAGVAYDPDFGGERSLLEAQAEKFAPTKAPPPAEVANPTSASPATTDETDENKPTSGTPASDAENGSV